jgi:hypothetical protein
MVRDHATNARRPRIGVLARAFLVAVADGDLRSLPLAEDLADAILGEPLVEKAQMLKCLLRERSPFALLRAVELAEALAGVVDVSEAWGETHRK